MRNFAKMYVTYFYSAFSLSDSIYVSPTKCFKSLFWWLSQSLYSFRLTGTRLEVECHAQGLLTLAGIFLEVKIKSGGFYRALAVSSSREIELGHRTSQISRYQIHLLLQSDFSKIPTYNLIVSDMKCAINSKVCIINCRLTVSVCEIKSLPGCVILELGSWWLANEANT